MELMRKYHHLTPPASVSQSVEQLGWLFPPPWEFFWPQCVCGHVCPSLSQPGAVKGRDSPTYSVLFPRPLRASFPISFNPFAEYR